MTDITDQTNDSGADEPIRVGIDIGSTAAKAAVVESGKLAFTTAIPTGYNSADAAIRLADELRARGDHVGDPRVCTVATGYGRVSVPFADKAVTEITCHGRGAAFLFGDDVTVVDVGGQDTKAIRLVKGKVSKFVMNDKCSAGTGKFLEIMANRLGVVSMPELSVLAREGGADAHLVHVYRVRRVRGHLADRPRHPARGHRLRRHRFGGGQGLPLWSRR